jgi:hypothetical protein
MEICMTPVVASEFQIMDPDVFEDCMDMRTVKFDPLSDKQEAESVKDDEKCITPNIVVSESEMDPKVSECNNNAISDKPVDESDKKKAKLAPFMYVRCNNLISQFYAMFTSLASHKPTHPLDHLIELLKKMKAESTPGCRPVYHMPEFHHPDTDDVTAEWIFKNYPKFPDLRPYRYRTNCEVRDPYEDCPITDLIIAIHIFFMKMINFFKNLWNRNADKSSKSD